MGKSDINVKKMRSDPIYFLEKILDLELTEYQRVALTFWQRKLAETKNE